MADPDLYRQCSSWLMVSREDAERFPDSVGEHAASFVHRGDRYTACELSSRHAGDCEASAGNVGTPGDPAEISVWFTWQACGSEVDPATEYRRIEAVRICPEESRGYACSRPPGHAGGHLFYVHT